ncbi:unnamed protein product [Rotaria sp. Silwood2]|nr:unnamed protein product [Rotaria sp. Silwood2]
MKLHRPLSHVKQSDHNMPTISQTTMDTKFIVVLFCVETGAWGFNSIHFIYYYASAIKLLVLLTLALHTLLMVIIYERDYINIKHCNENSRLIRGENLFTYVVLTRQAEHIAPSEDSTLITKQNLSPAESFETVNQEFIKEFI